MDDKFRRQLPKIPSAVSLQVPESTRSQSCGSAAHKLMYMGNVIRNYRLHQHTLFYISTCFPVFPTHRQNRRLPGLSAWVAFISTHNLGLDSSLHLLLCGGRRRKVPPLRREHSFAPHPPPRFVNSPPPPPHLNAAVPSFDLPDLDAEATLELLIRTDKEILSH